MREHCLKTPQSCIAKTPGKHCKRCTIIARNKTPEMRAAVSREKLARPSLTPEVIAKGQSPEVRRRVARILAEKAMEWCPQEYRYLYKQWTRANGNDRFTAAQAKAMILELIEKDKEKYIKEAPDRIAASHQRMKMGGRFIGGALIPLDELRRSR